MARARLSHVVVASLNFLSLLWSIFVILVSSLAIAAGSLECQSNQPVPMLLYGIFVLCLSLVALIGGLRANRRLLSIYATGLFVWIVWLLGFSAVLFLVSKASDAKAAKDHKEYQLNEYPAWVRRYAVERKRWDSIKKCMLIGQTCRRLLLDDDSDDYGDLRIRKSPILYGCCQPPLSCGFVNNNDTSWELPKSGKSSKDPDCLSWRNNLDQLCYDCNSCKAGYIRVLKEGWWRAAKSNAAFAVIIFIFSLLALCAFQQAPTETPTSVNAAAVCDDTQV